jgi:hypothetical protein
MLFLFVMLMKVVRTEPVSDIATNYTSSTEDINNASILLLRE